MHHIELYVNNDIPWLAAPVLISRICISRTPCWTSQFSRCILRHRQGKTTFT